MRALLLLLLTVGLIGSVPAPAARKPVLSWGKAGVSFDDYSADAVACGRQGYYLDVSGTEAATVFRAASKQLDANEADIASSAMTGDQDRVMTIAASSARIVDSARPRERMLQLRKMMEDAVGTCLVQHGYRRFRLTDQQQTVLRHFKKGSPERRAYLHSLAADPGILANQSA